MIRSKIMILCGLLLTGCAVTKETFDCKYSKGVGCRSITEVNTMLNDGKLNVSLNFSISTTFLPNRSN